jgi:hypothetical protein
MYCSRFKETRTPGGANYNYSGDAYRYRGAGTVNCVCRPAPPVSFTVLEHKYTGVETPNANGYASDESCSIFDPSRCMRCRRLARGVAALCDYCVLRLTHNLSDVANRSEDRSSQRRIRMQSGCIPVLGCIDTVYTRNSPRHVVSAAMSHCSGPAPLALPRHVAS